MKKLKKDDKPICPKCEGKGWYFVGEWIGRLQGRKDRECKKISNNLILKKYK